MNNETVRRSKVEARLRRVRSEMTRAKIRHNRNFRTDFQNRFLKFFETVQMHPNPNASERIRMDPNKSEHIRASPKTSKIKGVTSHKNRLELPGSYLASVFLALCVFLQFCDRHAERYSILLTVDVTLRRTIIREICFFMI